MKKWICIISTLALLFSLSACGQKSGDSSRAEESGLTVLATTYPVYLLASAVADGVEGVTVERLNTGAVSCLHDYTLSVGDMKRIEGADVLAINGVGLEDFMDDALASARGTVIDCSEGVALLELGPRPPRRGRGGRRALRSPHLDGPGERHRHGGQSLPGAE